MESEDVSCQDAILVEQAIQYHIKNLPSQVPVEQKEDDSIHYCWCHALGMHRIAIYIQKPWAWHHTGHSKSHKASTIDK